MDVVQYILYSGHVRWMLYSGHVWWILYSTYCTMDMYGGCCTVRTCTVDVVRYILYSGHVQWTRTVNMNGGHVPSSLLTVDEEIVEEEELSLLSVPCRDLYE